jgi:hypothetical protein
MDLSKVTFPTFVLEPRSMLERITDFMSHPDLIFGQVNCSLSSRYHTNHLRFLRAENSNDPEERFMRVLSYYLSWLAHQAKRRQKAVSCAYMFRNTPLNRCYRYNPVLGEFFRCRYDYANGTQGFYIAEQGKFYLYFEILFVTGLLWIVSLPSSSHFCIFLHFSCQSGEHNWGAKAKVEVPR